MNEPFRVIDLVGIGALGTTLIAGASGADRPVLWAHSCELAAPERWLGHDELLMTVGLSVPREHAAQVAMVQRLNAAGLAGLTLGDELVAPPLSAEMLAEADRIGFPVMRTDSSVPFASLARVVAAANADQQARHVVVLSQLYRALLDTHGHGREALLPILSRTIAARLAVVDVATAAQVLAGTLDVSEATLLAVAAWGRKASPTPHTRKVELDGADDGLAAWNVPARRPTLLLVETSERLVLDSFTAVHLGYAVSAEINRQSALASAAAKRASEVFDAIYEQRGDLGRLAQEASSYGFDTSSLRVLGMREQADERVQMALTLSGVPHASASRGGVILAVINASDLDKAVASLTRVTARIGISEVASTLSQLSQARYQAQVALDAIEDQEAGAVEYSSVTSSLVPPTADAADELVARVLGPLIAEDSARGTHLLETLCIYLDEDRNWAATAERIGLQRQSLAYRLKRIEALTHRNLRGSHDLAELWVARMALARANSPARP